MTQVDYDAIAHRSIAGTPPTKEEALTPMTASSVHTNAAELVRLCPQCPRPLVLGDADAPCAETSLLAFVEALQHAVR